MKKWEVIPLEYRKATKEDAEEIYRLVQDTMTAIYPKYYPAEVVDFFCRFHSRKSIVTDIDRGTVHVLIRNKRMIGTGSYEDNHITRVYVDPDFQGKGYGSYLMRMLEEEIARRYDTVYLDASLPASHLHEKRGYRTMKHERLQVENGAVLVYEIMQKNLVPIA